MNSYRFATEVEAKGFIADLKATWAPAGFVRDTRVKQSMDPVNSRWDTRSQEAVLLSAAPADAPMVMPVPASVPVPVIVPEDEDEIPSLVNEQAYRSGHDTKKKKQHHRINREAYRDYQDESQWLDEEGQILLSETLRDDLRNLMSHGACRHELSRQLYDGFKKAHDGRAPEGQNYTVTERPGYGGCRYEIDQDVRQLKGVFSGDGDGPNYAITEFLVTKAAKNRGIKLQTLKTKSLAKLVTLAEEMGVEGAGIPLRMMRKPELIHEIIKNAENAEDDLHAFDVGEKVRAAARCSS